MVRLGFASLEIKTFGLQRSLPWNNNAPFRKGHQQGLRYSQCSQSGLKAQLQLSQVSTPWAALYTLQQLLSQCPHHGNCRSSGRSVGFSAGVFTSTRCLFGSKMRMVSSPFHPSPQSQWHPCAFWECWQRVVHPQQPTYGRRFSSHLHQVWHEEQT